jgi:phosphoserine phosphatase
MSRFQLAFFDLDGTLKMVRDPYMYLHRHLGTLAQGRVHLEMFRRGEISYKEWAHLDVGQWAGRKVSEVEGLLRAIPYVPGAREVVAALRAGGAKVVIVSSGLDLHGRQVMQDLGCDALFTNELGVRDGTLTGEVRVRLDLDNKGEIVRRLQHEWDVPPSACLAVGDGESDIPMFQRVGLSVAVNPASDQVRAAADIVIEEPDLRALLPVLNARS